MVSQRRYASRRHSSIQVGSFFFAEMKRTVSSDRPLGALSDSISVTNPYLYWSISMLRTRSMVSCPAGISSSAAVLRTAGWYCHLNRICEVHCYECHDALLTRLNRLPGSLFVGAIRGSDRLASPLM